MVKNPHTKEGAKNAIVEAAGIMLSIGGSWPTIHTELFRQTTNPDFERWTKDDLPSQSTLERWLLAEAGAKDLTELKQKRLEAVKTRLQNKALTMAFAGDRALLIFSLKNLCGWVDKHAIEDSRFDEGKNSDLLRAVPRKAFLRLTKKHGDKESEDDENE